MTRKKLLDRKPLAELAAKKSVVVEPRSKIQMNGRYTSLPTDPPGVQFVYAAWSSSFMPIKKWLIEHVDKVGGYHEMERRTKVPIVELSIARCDWRLSKRVLQAASEDGLREEVLHFCMDAILGPPPLEPAKSTVGLVDHPIQYSHRSEIDAIIKKPEKK